jgi:hypothetical protein
MRRENRVHFESLDKDHDPAWQYPESLMAARQIDIAQQTMPDGTSAVVVTTGTARYVYDTVGGGFSALLDREGNDWINYSAAKGPSGQFRGIPNMVFRRRGLNNHFHPGHRNERACTTEVSRGPNDTVTIESQVGGRWQVRWEITDNGAHFTTEKVDPDDSQHWFLYEGTPGGRFRPRDRCIRSDGFGASLSDRWEADTSLIDWVAFASKKVRRSLLFKWESPATIPVSYYPMKPMTVFGLGRRLGSVEGYLTTLSTMTMTFVESTSFDGLSEAAKAVSDFS